MKLMETLVELKPCLLFIKHIMKNMSCEKNQDLLIQIESFIICFWKVKQEMNVKYFKYRNKSNVFYSFCLTTFFDITSGER